MQILLFGELAAEYRYLQEHQTEVYQAGKKAHARAEAQTGDKGKGRDGSGAEVRQSRDRDAERHTGKAEEKNEVPERVPLLFACHEQSSVGIYVCVNEEGGI